MSQVHTFRGHDAESIVLAGLASSGRCIYTSKDEVVIKIYRGYKGEVGLKVEIFRKEGEEDRP